MYTLLVQLLFYNNKGASTKNLSRLADFACLGGGGLCGNLLKKENLWGEPFFLDNVYYIKF